LFFLSACNIPSISPNVRSRFPFLTNVGCKECFGSAHYLDDGCSVISSSDLLGESALQLFHFDRFRFRSLPLLFHVLVRTNTPTWLWNRPLFFRSITPVSSPPAGLLQFLAVLFMIQPSLNFSLLFCSVFPFLSFHFPLATQTRRSGRRSSVPSPDICALGLFKIFSCSILFLFTLIFFPKEETPRCNPPSGLGTAPGECSSFFPFSARL